MAETAPHTEPSPHIRRKRRQRKEEILRTALGAFRERGYHATTVDEIAGRLGLRKAALYYYFPDKEAILYEGHRRLAERVERILEEALRHERPIDQLGHAIREHVRLMTEQIEGLSLAAEIPALAPAHHAEVLAARDAYERGLRSIIASGVRSGELRPLDPKLAAFVILGAVNWVAHWYRPDGSAPAPELAAHFAEQLLGGLRAPCGAGRAAPEIARPTPWRVPQ
jgi:AcrR family transcriptional regulator